MLSTHPLADAVNDVNRAVPDEGVITRLPDEGGEFMDSVMEVYPAVDVLCSLAVSVNT